LLENPEASSKLFVALAPHIDHSKIDIFRFADVIKQFIKDLGKTMDNLHPYLKENGSNTQDEADLICSVGELLKTIEIEPIEGS
jgi:hypothetical protein